MSKIYSITTASNQVSISRRNRKILEILKQAEKVSSTELSKTLNLKESTVLVELKYLEKLGVVQEVS